MKQRQILVNALTTFGQELGSAVVLFLLYRFLIRALGTEQFGIWSLVLATTSVVTLANQGFSTSIVKFVAKYAAQERPEDVSTLIQTAVISIGLALAFISLGIYPAATRILKFLLHPAALALASQILPFALLSLWLNIVGSILLAGLSGHQRLDFCNYVVFGGSILFLLLSHALVPGRGLLGLAYAQTAQSLACLLATWILLRRKIPEFPLVPRHWNSALLREIRSYGMQFQLITISQAIREPVTKALLAKFGGLAATGYYDIASRWVVSFREIIVQANQVLVPTVANLQERDARSLPALYRESYRLIFFLSIPTFAFVVIAAPLVSRIWVGSYQPIFVAFVALLAGGWLVNSLANSAYVFDLGTGELRWVLVGCVATGILNAVLGFLLGERFGGGAVVAVSAATLALGYIAILVSYHLHNRAPFTVLLPTESVWIALASLGGVFIFLPVFRSASAHAGPAMKSVAVALGALLAILGVPIWIHPLRKRLLSWALSRTAA